MPGKRRTARNAGMRRSRAHVRAQIRSSQLTTPFCSGSIFTTPGGVSVIISSPAEWDYIKNGSDAGENYIIHDARLEEFLGVRELRLPPDQIQVYRFPQWHFCNKCGRMQKQGMKEPHVRLSCPEAGCSGKMIQVRFVAICGRGHLQDVDWIGWVHRDRPCGDAPQLKWIAGDQPGVKCESCGSYRPVSQLFETFSSEKRPNYLQCRGQMPWLGNRRESCGEKLTHTLRSATNVCFPVVKSSINLGGIQEERLRGIVQILKDRVKLLSFDDEQFVDLVRENLGQHLRELGLNPETIDSEELLRARRIARGEESAPWQEARPDEAFRRMEYDLLKSNDLSVPGLIIRQVQSGGVPDILSNHFDRIARVEKMIETRALLGFTRLMPEYGNPAELKRLLWGRDQVDWLPAAVVHGEGIFLEFSRTRLENWKREYRHFIDQRMARLNEALARSFLVSQDSEEKTAIFSVTLSSEFVLIHTFAHLVINELVLECGYSSASLRERLYVGQDMAGVLIYTASGDSEGTLGGLVAMAEPERLSGVLRRALRRATWCSVDPVCSELGERGGQGPEGCNLAACYACAMVPETACEHMNRWLDRGLVVGTPWNREAGFFSEFEI